MVLDLNRNHAEVCLIAQEIRRLKPGIPAIVLAETKVVARGLRELSGAVVVKESDPQILLKFLTDLLPAEISDQVGPIPLTLPLLAETVSP